MSDRIEIKIFSEKYVNQLIRGLREPEIIKRYQEKKFSYEENYPIGSTGIFLNNDIKLDPGNDFQSSITLYENLNLNETQASDKRLWVYLTHVIFWDYMRERWPIKKNREYKPVNRIRDRYLLTTLNLRTLTRNGISRLWWYTHLTVDEDRKNKYELTEILLSRADLTVGITERALGSSYNARTAILEFLKENEEIRQNETKTRSLITGLNLAGGPKAIPYLDKSAIKNLLGKVSENI